MRYLLAVALAITLACVIALASVSPAMASEPSLDSLATQLVGQPTTVECYPPDGEYAGYVILPDPVIHLSGEICGSLRNVLQPGPRTAHWERTFDGQQFIGYGFLALVHEATHLIEYHSAVPTSAYDEGLTECTAIRNTWPALKLLGLPWKVRKGVYEAATYSHNAMPTTGINASYRSVC